MFSPKWSRFVVFGNWLRLCKHHCKPESRLFFNSDEECAIMQTEVNTLTGKIKRSETRSCWLLGFYFWSFVLEGSAQVKADWSAPLSSLLIGCDQFTVVLTSVRTDTWFVVWWLVRAHWQALTWVWKQWLTCVSRWSVWAVRILSSEFISVTTNRKSLPLCP